MTIGIIAAMDEELNRLKSLVIISETREIAGIKFHIAKLDSLDVVIVQSGIGKAAAAMATTLLCVNFNVRAIYNTGTAGGIDPNLSIGDVIIGEQMRYFDADVTAFGYSFGQLPNQPEFFLSDRALFLNAKSCSKNKALEYDFAVHTGLILSGDKFVSSIEDKDQILTQFPSVQALDMESSAIAQVANQMGIPFIIIRSVSDHAGSCANSAFKNHLELASKNATNFLVDLILDTSNKLQQFKKISKITA